MVEELIVDKAKGRRHDSKEAQFNFPYDLGTARNWEEIMGRRWITWFLPVKFGGEAVWPTLCEGAGHFDLSVEQLAQKANKLARSISVQAVADFDSGETSRCFCRYWCG
eukprot:CAMPEP_0115583368 /NCGR_PEP_ID=MMETSP0272-20121206/6137_1 /TAXON_ID=71861 /ORGANISM="Scrippsiella trochoidea, Strain CCMP3099" /LENGTH=108 /DNA_ID=CAMNT_0003018379 /DNA_START=358 /DNA_END=681 /DNA_ORIENTATION=+